MDQVLKFLSDQNRPFTINDIVQSLQLSKSQVVSALNKLLEQNRIIEKNCGKQKIYCVSQKASLPLKDVNVLQLEREANSLALKLKEIDDDLEKKRAQLQKLEGSLTKEQVLEMQKNLQEEIKDLQVKLSAFQGEPYEKKDKEKIEREYRNVMKEYNKRKRLCMDMVEAIFENYPKSKKTLLQEMGVETDDDVGFKVKVPIK